VPDNLHSSEAGFSALPGHQLVTLQGPDAVSYAQAQFSNDLSALAPGQWQWSTWLTAKGRVTAVFMLCRLSEDALLMVLADGRAEEIASGLQRYVFRRKVRIAARGDLHVGGRFSASGTEPAQIRADGEGWAFDLGTATLARTLCVDAREFTAQDGFELSWRQADLQCGLPRLDASPAEQWTPQQIGLDRLTAYSVKKGCYPGQEIVARTHFLGKAKRVAQLVQVPVGTQVGDSLQSDSQPVGTVACVAGELALAVLPIDSEDLPLLRDGVPVARLVLLEGLAR
jgi:folate-binding protein YgfZ